MSDAYRDMIDWRLWQLAREMRALLVAKTAAERAARAREMHRLGDRLRTVVGVVYPPEVKP